MQATDVYSAARRNIDFEDFIDSARRHKSWILGPTFAGLVIATVVAFLWPDTYVSSALVRITSSQVPERFVATNINQMLTERINAIAQGVLSRSTLTNIIQTYDLYPRERRRYPIDDVVEQMRNKDIKIGVINLEHGRRSVGAFPISFRYENRHLAQKVTADIVSRLINENERETLSSSQQTTDLMTSEVEKAKQRLDEIESKLSDFRIRNAGNLPEERSTNITALNSLDQRASSINASISRVNQDKLLLESQLRIYREQLARQTEAATVSGDPVRIAAKNEQLQLKEREIASNEQMLIQLKEMYKDTHPDVQRVKANLATLVRQRDELQRAEDAAQRVAAKAAADAPKRVVVTREMQALDANIKQTESLIRAKDLELKDLNEEVQRLTGQVRNYQNRISSSPLADQLYAQLTRDYSQAKDAYLSLKVKQEESQRGTEVIRNKQGETLDLLDQASLPAKPAEPNRYLIVGVGTFLGLLLGIALAGIREVKDTTLKNLKDVRVYTQLTVLGCVPLIEDDIVVKRRKRLALLGWATAIIVGILMMAGAVAYYYATNT
jgi:uncharacterized protein involved in exopolysaccharide biosynthesis